MPAGCLEKECRDCEFHIIKGGVLDCNVKNRLKLAEPTMGIFATSETDKEVLKRKVAAKKKEAEKLEEQLEEVEGEKDAGVS